jgi:hypothetical protein
VSPRQLFEHARSAIASNGGEFGRRLAAQVRDNPVPTVLTGIGLAWLMSASPDGETTPATARATSPVGTRAREAAGKTAGVAHDTAASVAAAARIGAASVRSGGRSIRSGFKSLHEGYDYLRDEQPAALGAIAVAIGAIAGSLLPATRTEERYLGPARNAALRRADEQGARLVEAAENKLAESRPAR